MSTATRWCWTQLGQATSSEDGWSTRSGALTLALPLTAASRPNEATQPGRDFKKLNRMAIIKGSGLTPTQAPVLPTGLDSSSCHRWQTFGGPTTRD
eukprot:768781-Hanusia_phi.AAC.19